MLRRRMKLANQIFMFHLRSDFARPSLSAHYEMIGFIYLFQKCFTGYFPSYPEGNPDSNFSY